MDINIEEIGIKDAAHILESLSLVTRDSMENDELPVKAYTGVLELIESLSTAIVRETGAVA